MPKMIISKHMYSKVKKVKRSKDYICLIFLNIPTGCKRKVEGIFFIRIQYCFVSCLIKRMTKDQSKTFGKVSLKFFDTFK